MLVRLGDQGGEVRIRIWDHRTNRFIHATLGLVRTGVGERDFGAMTTATAEDGAGTVVFLPAGSYRVALEQYPCGAKTYFASEAEFNLEVPAGQRLAKVISVDTSSLKAIESSDNLNGKRCGE